MLRSLILAAAGAAAIAGASFAGGHDMVKPEIGDPVSLRKNIMKNVGGAMGMLGAIAKGEAEFEPRVAEAAFRTMNAGALGFSGLFPAGSTEAHGTTAGPKIWEDSAGFETAVQKFIDDTAAAVAAKPQDKDAFMAVFGKVAGNCKACHEAYRIKKD